MTWVRLLQEGQSCWGQLQDGRIQVCVGVPWAEGHHCRPHPTLERLPYPGTPLLPPCQPTKIVCIGRNYRAHAEELRHAVPETPLFFLKPPSSLLAPGGAILLPPLSRQVEHEGELGVVIGRRCHRLAPGADVRPYIFGYTAVNDVTARDLQNRDPQWTRAKGFDTFCPVGPVVVESPGANAERPWAGLKIQVHVNGELRQTGNTDDFLFSLAAQLAAITAVMTLEPGDLVATGTPSGVGPLHPGDRVAVNIAGIGVLENTVAAAPQA